MTSFQTWVHRFRQDLQPTPGRLAITLRIVLATVLAVILVMTFARSGRSFRFVLHLLARS